ncbi:hypothetical protein COW46_03660 [Candidatus Gracilibacteria bacterium CG17_big_fil_post_rev_8_21_14_2_50_48_13]|nr:MAG: hypothetical protein COW46_03660 [Candidatus Gracilibacteria bacterium CG17_big_fil_post_rev_8_21_14_2_50_48_13]
MKNTLIGVLLVLVAVLVGTLLMVTVKAPPLASTGVLMNTNVATEPSNTNAVSVPITQKLESPATMTRSVAFGKEIFTSTAQADLRLVSTTATSIPTRTEYCATFADGGTCDYDAGKLRDAQRAQVSVLSRYLAGERPALEAPLHSAFATEAGGYMSTMIMELDKQLPGSDQSYVAVTMEGQDVGAVLTLRAFAKKGDVYYTLTYPLNDATCVLNSKGCAITSRVEAAYATCKMEEALLPCLTATMSSDARLRAEATKSTEELFSHLTL